MFGKPEWFQPKPAGWGWGLYPVTREGWTYLGVWTGVLALPFLAIFLIQGVVFGLVWLAFATGVLVWDVKEILGQMKKDDKDENLIHISDDDSTTLATRKYDMELRD